MSVLSVANAAGSAGKTTTAVTLAALLAQTGRPVRLIDLDPQGNASHATGITLEPGQPTIADVLTGRAGIDAADRATAIDGLRVLPADPDGMEGLEAALSRTVGAEQRLRIALEAAEPVDVTVIDCPGSVGLLTVAALVASYRVLTVAMPTVKELAGLPRIDSVIAQVAAAYRPKLILAGVVPCKVPPPQRGRLYTRALALLAQQWGGRVTPSVRDSVRVPEAYAARIPLPVYDPRAAVTDDYRAVLDYLEPHLA